MVIILAALVAWLLPVVAGWLAWRGARTSYLLVKHGIRTTGQVIGAWTNRCKIQFSVDGVNYKIGSEWYVLVSVGDLVPVVYLPGSPEQARVYFWQDLWMPPFLWLVVAVFFAVLDIWY
jgi:hypothetical protein